MSPFALLDRVRARTLALVEQLSDAQLVGQHSPLMSPIVWDLAHIAAFEQLWLQCKLVDDGGCIDALVDPEQHPRAVRGCLVLPGPTRALEVLAETRQVSVAHTNRAETELARRLVERGFVYNMVAQHEAQHLETILAAVQLLPDAALVRKAPHEARAVPLDMVEVAGGRFLMGTDSPHAYDNEKPAHEVEVQAFAIDRHPVTNGAYLEFIEAGAYADLQWWSEEGWRWVQEVSAEAPLFWRRTKQGWTERVFSQTERLDPLKPVIHVCAHEADAYATWAGKRLPTETEWERAAAWDPELQVSLVLPWTDVRQLEGNYDLQFLGTTRVGSWPGSPSPSGCEGMLGDVWEWTSSTFQAYPGFEPWPYSTYSACFFNEGYRVLRGASFATDRAVARNTVRNWDHAQRRQIFAGFRCAQSL